MTSTPKPSIPAVFLRRKKAMASALDAIALYCWSGALEEALLKDAASANPFLLSNTIPVMPGHVATDLTEILATVGPGTVTALHQRLYIPFEAEVEHAIDVWHSELNDTHDELERALMQLGIERGHIDTILAADAASLFVDPAKLTALLNTLRVFHSRAVDIDGVPYVLIG